MVKEAVQDQEQPQLQVQEHQRPSLNDLPFPSFLIDYLYAGHFLARWGARTWEFSVALYMISVWPDSLLLAAIYGVIASASTALFGSIIGELVDRLSYLKVLRLWLVTKNLSFVIAGVTVIVLLIWSTLRSTNFGAFVLLVILTNISGAAGVLSTLAGTILVEREWVVVIAESHSPELLTRINYIIRRIDLTCKLFAPIIASFIISFVSLKASAITFALWNIISVWVEYWLFLSVLDGIPALGESSRKRCLRFSPTNIEDGSSTSDTRKSLLPDDEGSSTMVEKRGGWKILERFSKAPFVGAWIVYLQQDVVLPGVSLALLYFTVLSFGTLMTAALEWNGIPTYVIGIARGISATIGIAATVAYPVLHSRISTRRTGLWSIWSQWACLLVCVASILVRNNLLSACMLMGGVAASRLGLWMFDLSVIQQMQDDVPESDRCIVGGVQNSLQSYLDLLGYVMGIIISNPQDFWKLILISFLVVTLAALLYSLHMYHVRKHLIHFEKLLMLFQWSLRSSEIAIVN